MTTWLFLSLWGAACVAGCDSAVGIASEWLGGTIVTAVVAFAAVGAWSAGVATSRTIDWYRERRAFKRIGMVPPARVVRR